MNHIDIWTDGACRGNPGLGGYGIVMKFTDKDSTTHIKEIKKAVDNTTNNQMELMAAVVALTALNKPCNVTLTSDSKYLVDAFEKGWVDAWINEDFRQGRANEVKNIDIWKELISLTKVHKVQFVWTKGHADNIDNQRCDKLANEAMDEYIKNKLANSV